MPWREIAKKHDISERHARSIWVEGLHDQAMDLYPTAPIAVIMDAILRFEQTEETMAALFLEATKIIQEKVQVRKMEMNALADRLVLLRRPATFPPT